MAGRNKRASVAYFEGLLEGLASHPRVRELFEGRPTKYVLDGRTPVACPDVLEWGSWMETSQRSRRVGATEIERFTVYTTFLGIDHNFFGSGPPLIFETMIDYKYAIPHTHKVFGRETIEEGGWLDYQERYSTWDEAEEGHARACAYLEANFSDLVAQAEQDERRRYPADIKVIN